MAFKIIIDFFFKLGGQDFTHDKKTRFWSIVTGNGSFREGYSFESVRFFTILHQFVTEDQKRKKVVIIYIYTYCVSKNLPVYIYILLSVLY